MNLAHRDDPFAHRCGAFFKGFPFVDQHHQPFASILHEIHDIDVLGMEAPGGVDHDQGHIALINGAQSAHGAVILDVIADTCLAAQTGSVNQAQTL